MNSLTYEICLLAFLPRVDKVNSTTTGQQQDKVLCGKYKTTAREGCWLRLAQSLDS